MLNSIPVNGFLSRLTDSAQSRPLESVAPQAAADEKFTSGIPATESHLQSAFSFRSEQTFHYSESMSLQLTTQEGDQVSVDFRQLYAAYQSYKEMQTAESQAVNGVPQGKTFYQSSESMQMSAFEERFAFSVQGELNLDELKAIFAVFDQVDDIANQFYGGNLEKALQSATELNLDYSQLQSMQLNLTQTARFSSRQQQAALAEYGAVQNASTDKESPQFGAVEQLPEYYQKWQEALDRLDQWFTGAQEAWEQLTGKVAAQRFPEQDSEQGWVARMQEFHQQLAAYAAGNPSLESSGSGRAESAEKDKTGLKN